MNSPEIEEYFSVLEADLAGDGNESELQVRYEMDMGFSVVTLVENERITDDISILTFDHELAIEPGEFIFLWIPGLGEKPFSALTDKPFQLVVINLGQFTERLLRLEPGARAYVRGPHGTPVQPPQGAHIIAVAGGTGLAGVFQIARDYRNVDIFMGARSAERLYFVNECEGCATVHLATDDGSRGFHRCRSAVVKNDIV